MIKGWIEKDGKRYVEIHGDLLTPDDSLKVINHSPTGFSWGYGGSGPAQLALAILLRFTRQNEAQEFHQLFKWEVIAELPLDGNWQMTDDSVHKWLDQKRQESLPY